MNDVTQTQILLAVLYSPPCGNLQCSILASSSNTLQFSVLDSMRDDIHKFSSNLELAVNIKLKQLKIYE